MRLRLPAIDPATLVFLAGVSAALHVGKLPPAVPALREALGITLVQAGFLLSLVQFAGMLLGLLIGVAVDGIGLKRSIVGGLVIVGAASVLGGEVDRFEPLVVLRAIEGLGYLLIALPAPTLTRQLVPAARLAIRLGVWSTFMPLGTALALLIGPSFIAAFGWRIWWDLPGVLSLAMAWWLWRALPAARAHERAAPAVRPSCGDGAATQTRAPAAWPKRLQRTLAAPGPWLVALSFAVYSGQWLAVIGFLPSIYTQAGIAGAVTGVLTALAAAGNIVGNAASGRLLHRGLQPHRVLTFAFVCMALAAAAAFAEVGGTGLPLAARYLAVLLFSMLGGLIPGTLFTLALRLAPSEDTAATTVGWMQQWSAIGQFIGPPVVAWVASLAGGWQWTWVVTGICSLLGIGLARLVRGRTR